MSKIEQLKIMEKDKQLFTDSFNICWKLLKTRNYYISNRENNHLFSELSIIYGQNMYEAMLVTMDDIIKSNVHSIVVNEKPENESDKIIPREKTVDTVDKCLNGNNNSILVDHGSQVQQDDKVTSITNETQNVPLKRKFPDDFMHITKKSKPDCCQPLIDTEKNKSLNENCKKSLNVKNETSKLAVNVVSSFSNVNSVGIVKKNKVTSVKADSTDNNDDITIIESKKIPTDKIMNDKAPVKLKAPISKKQNDKNNDHCGDDITIIESKRTNSDKNINDKTPAQLKTKISQIQNGQADNHCDNTTAIESKKINKDKNINDKTPTKLKVPINKTQKNDKAEKHHGNDNITLIEKKKINTNNIVNEKTATKVKTPVNNIQQNDKIDNQCDDLNEPRENKIVNKKSNQIHTVENIKIISVQSMAPVTMNSIDVVTLDDDDSIQVTEVEVLTEDCIDIANDDVVDIPNNLNNTNELGLQVHSNEISSRYINEIIDVDHNYSKKMTDIIDIETTNNNSTNNCHANNTSMVTVHFCDVNKLEDIILSDAEEYNELNSTNDKTAYNNFSNYYDHDYNGNHGEDDNDNDNDNDPIGTMNDSTNFDNIGRIVNDIPFEEKKRIVKLAEKHPSWTIKMLRKKSGCEKLLGQHQLNSWRRIVERGGSALELRYSFNNWIYNKCLDSYRQNEKITNKKIQNWGLEAKKLSCYKNLKFVAKYQWLENFKRNYQITGDGDNLILDPDQKNYSYKLSRVLVPYELKVKVVNLASEHKDWNLEMLKKQSGCNYLESFAQITSWKHLIKKGQSLWDKYKKLNNWIYNKYNEYKSKNKKVTDKMLISWRNEAKKVLQFTELPKINHNYQWVRTFKRDFNIT